MLKRIARFIIGSALILGITIGNTGNTLKTEDTKSAPVTPVSVEQIAAETVLTPTLTPTLTPSVTEELLTADKKPPIEKTAIKTADNTITPVSVPAKKTETDREFIVNAWANGRVNFRKGDSSSTKILCSVPKYSELYVKKKQNNGWSSVSFIDINGKRYDGYVFSSYISYDKPDITPTPICKKNNNWSIYPGMLVNFDNAVINSGKPENLVNVKDYINLKGFSCASGVKANKTAVKQLNKMCLAMKEDGVLNISVSASGGYREFSLQEGYSENYDYWDIYDKPVKTQMATGSEHRTGFGFDLMAGSTVYKWIAKHGENYGFIKRYSGDKSDITGIIDEPWHFTYVGKKLAKFLNQNNLCLEEFYSQYIYNASEIGTTQFRTLYNNYLENSSITSVKKNSVESMVHGIDIDF